MVEAGMPVDITDGSGLTALITATVNNRTDVVRCLLDKGANVNKQTFGLDSATYCFLQKLH